MVAVVAMAMILKGLSLLGAKSTTAAVFFLFGEGQREIDEEGIWKEFTVESEFCYGNFYKCVMVESRENRKLVPIWLDHDPTCVCMVRSRSHGQRCHLHICTKISFALNCFPKVFARVLPQLSGPWRPMDRRYHIKPTNFHSLAINIVD